MTFELWVTFELWMNFELLVTFELWLIFLWIHQERDTAAAVGQARFLIGYHCIERPAAQQ